MDEYLNKKVSVYYNQHKSCFSVRYKNKVVGYLNYLKLINVNFTVRKSGRLNVLKTKQKNVHAFVKGILTEIDTIPKNFIINENETIMYNPYLYDSFVFSLSKEPIYNCKEVILNNDNYKIFKLN